MRGQHHRQIRPRDFTLVGPEVMSASGSEGDANGGGRRVACIIHAEFPCARHVGRSGRGRSVACADRREKLSKLGSRLPISADRRPREKFLACRTPRRLSLWKRAIVGGGGKNIGPCGAAFANQFVYQARGVERFAVVARAGHDMIGSLTPTPLPPRPNGSAVRRVARVLACDVRIRARIIGGSSSFASWTIQCFVALAPVPDLLLCAKHLFVAAMLTSS